MGEKFRVVYVTASQFKIEENRLFVEGGSLDDGTPVADLCYFDIRQVPIKEVLEVDLPTMVIAEVSAAYSQLRVPCIVEHAGLLFDGYASYPGGLTKPMWNELGDRFIEETHAEGRRALARAVVAYCDGRIVRTFVGETSGRIASAPRGDRRFYWDTVFIPDRDGLPGNQTYAEIVEDSNLGLRYKVLELSQSTRAMRKFLEYRREAGPSPLWPRSS